MRRTLLALSLILAGFHQGSAGEWPMYGGNAARTQETAEIRNVLTAEQRTKFDARQKEMADRRASGGHKGWGRKGAGAPPAKS